MEWLDMVRGRDKWLGTVKAAIKLLADIAKRVTACGRTVSGRMFGGIQVNENWRKRYNIELMQLLGDLDIPSFVRISRLDWLVMLIEWIVEEK